MLAISKTFIVIFSIKCKKPICMNFQMNQNIFDEISQQLNHVNEIPEIKQIVETACSSHDGKSTNRFNAEYLNAEWAKIKSAREKDYPTCKSEYRVVKH